MKIRNRLTLQFTCLVAIILSLILSAIYYIAYQHTRSDFYSRLSDRVLVTAHIFLEADEINQVLFQDLLEKYTQKLQEEVIQGFDKDNIRRFIEKNEEIYYPVNIVDHIRTHNEIKFSEGERQYYGIFYHDNQGDFV